MRSRQCLITLAVVLVPLGSAHASPRNWIDRYIAAHGHCMQQPNGPFTTLNPMEKPIEEWNDADLADLKAALDRCDALPEEQTGGSRSWTGSLYDRYAELVHAQQQRAAIQEDAKASARDRAAQAEATRERQVAADSQAAAARTEALKRAADLEIKERKAAEDRAAAAASELKAAAQLAEATEARAKAAHAEAKARYEVEAAKQRATQAEADVRNADAQARAERQAADQRFADAHPETSAPAAAPAKPPISSEAGIDSQTSCAFAAGAFDSGDVKTARAIDRYVEDVMRYADQINITQNHRSLIANIPSDGFAELRAATISYCRENKTKTVLQASIAMFGAAAATHEQ